MEKKHIEGEGKQILERMKDVPVFCAEFDVLTQLTGFKLTRGMLCAMKRRPLPEVSLCLNSLLLLIFWLNVASFIPAVDAITSWVLPFSLANPLSFE